MTPAASKADVAEQLGQAGSIPVRLRHRLPAPTLRSDERRPAAAGAAHRHAARRPAAGRRRASGWAAAWSRTSSSGCSSGSGTARSRRRTPSTPSSPRCRATASSLRPVLNATGVLVHTNLGRAPLSPAAVEAVVAASGTTDVELDLATGRRGPARARRAIAALLAAVPAAEAALVVNNCAAALAAGRHRARPGPRDRAGPRRAGRDRRRLPASPTCSRPPAPGCARSARPTGSRSPTTAAPSAPDTGAVLKVHPSNFVVRGFTRAVEVARAGRRARRHRVPLVADIGSGLLGPHPLLPDEPDLQSTLAAGADLVTASGDKLLGGPQAGLLLGRAELVQRLRRHPLARALRVDKPTLAALEATLRGPLPPVQEMLAADLDGLRAAGPRAGRPARRRRGSTRSPSTRRPASAGEGRPSTRCRAPPCRCRRPSPTRCGAASPPVVGYVEGDRTLLDLRSLPPSADERAGRRRAGGGPPVDVIATAGHVDHGKSALVRALTGMEPDRWAEERRRGLTIDLGFAWTTLPSGRRLAFVDVPGHERFVGNMLAGVGLGAGGAVRGRGRRRLVGADRRARRRPRRARRAARPARGDQGRPRRPGPGARRRARAARPRRRWATCPGSRSARAPAPGCPSCVAALEALLAGLPAPDPAAPVRLWVDRAFTIRGAGTVVTGTLAAGTVARRRPAAARRTARSSSAACSRSASRSSGRPRRPGWRSTCAGSPSRSSPAATRCSPRAPSAPPTSST